MYMGAVYWAVQTVTTVGYGNIVPTTISERVVACFVMLGGFVFLDDNLEGCQRFRARQQREHRGEKARPWPFIVEKQKIPRSLIVRINAYYKNEKDDSFGNNLKVNVLMEKPGSDSLRRKLLCRHGAAAIIDAFLRDHNAHLEMFVEFMWPKDVPQTVPRGRHPQHDQRVRRKRLHRVCARDLAARLAAGRKTYSRTPAGAPHEGVQLEKISDASYDSSDDPGAGCLLPPGALINPGVALGFESAACCAPGRTIGKSST